MNYKKLIRICTERSELNMTYDEFIMDIICGHEFICEIEEIDFKILNLYEGFYSIRLGEKRYDISEDEGIEGHVIYNGMTLKELMNKNMIKIKEMY